MTNYHKKYLHGVISGSVAEKNFGNACLIDVSTQTHSLSISDVRTVVQSPFDYPTGSKDAKSHTPTILGSCLETKLVIEYSDKKNKVSD